MSSAIKKNTGMAKYAGSLLIGVILVAIVVSLSRLSWAEVQAALYTISMAGYLLLFGMYTVHLWLVSRRWSLVVRRVSNVGVYAPGFFFYNITLAQVARLLPLSHMAGFGTKLFSLKVDSGTPVTHGFFCTLVEIVFNLFTIGLMVLSGLIILLGSGTMLAGILSAISALVCTVVFVFWFKELFSLGLALISRIAGLFGRFRIMADRVEAVRSLADTLSLPCPLVVKMLALTISFYALGLARGLFIAWLMGIEVTALDFYSIYALSLLISLVGITPSGLGVVEAGWVGILMHLGIPADQAASYALVKRIVDETTLILLAGCGYSLFKAGQSWDKNNNKRVPHHE
ncbi:flippase-like domain-containing protein [Pseudodesulfovibrio sp.]|nr:flippase-like domain-containing protein [Pseudodesulfovibrio sp.]